MNKKRPVSKVFIAIGIAFSFIALCTFGFLIAFDISSDNRYFKQSREIVDTFSSWCKSKRYVYYDVDTEQLKFGPNNQIRNIDTEIKKAFPEINTFTKTQSFLHKENYIYFSGVEKISGFGNRFCIYKSSKDRTSLERMETIELRNSLSVKSAFGFGNLGYYMINEKYYIYDFKNEKMENIDHSSDETIFDGEKQYLDSLEIETSECKTNKEGVCNYYYRDELNEFNENCIPQDYLYALRKYKFNVSWQVSFPSGLTSFAYIGNKAWMSDCVVLTFNRYTKTILDYQLFTGVSGFLEYSHLYPDINLTDIED